MDDHFETITLSRLEGMPGSDRDALPFGVVGFDAATIVHIYSSGEARMSGLDPASVMGVPFFDAVGQCMNNFMVAQRFEDDAELDELVPYVLTLRMRPTRVRLRLLAGGQARYRYLLIER